MKKQETGGWIENRCGWVWQDGGGQTDREKSTDDDYDDYDEYHKVLNPLINKQKILNKP